MPEELRTAPEVIITWQDGELMADNFRTRRCIEISKDVMLILHHCASGIAHDDLRKALLADGFDITDEELVAAELDLLQAGLLIDQEAARQQDDLIGRNPSWSYWGPEAQYFHFATKDAPYVVKATKESVDYFDEMVNAPQPPLVKRYAMADRLLLPRVRSDLPQKFSDVLLERRTVRDFTRAPVGVEQLSVLCDLAFAPQRFVNADPFGALPLRTYANAGARSELEVYVNAINVDGVDPGLYHYNGIEHSLELIGEVWSRADMAYLSYEQDMCSAAAVSFIVTARVGRVGHKYRNPRALRAIYADGGHLAQTFSMIATACGLGAWQTLAFIDTEIEQKLGLDGVAETVIYLLGAGVPADESAHTPISLNDAKRTNFYEDVDLPPVSSAVGLAPTVRPPLWRRREFLLLWSGQTISEIGSGVTQLALPLTAVAILRASTFEVGVLSAATSVAFAVIALPAGALVDRLAKRRVMIVSDAARLAIVGSVPIAWWAGVLSMAQLYVVAGGAGICAVFFDVAYQSYLPILLSPQELMDGNGKLSTTQSSAELIGPGLGGALAGAVGAAAAMTVDAVSYAVSVVSLLSIRGQQQAGQSEAAAAPVNRSRLREEMAEGFRFVVSHPILAKVAACSATANLFGSMGTAVEMIFLVRVLHVRTGFIGLIFVLAAAGSIVGGAASNRVIRSVGSARVIWVAVLVFGFPQLVVALAEPGWGVIWFSVGYATAFFSATVYGVAQVSYRQSVCPPPLMGRVNAVNRWLMWGMLPLGAVIGGALGTAIGIRGTLWIALTGTWAAGLWVYFSDLRGMRDFPPA